MLIVYYFIRYESEVCPDLLLLLVRERLRRLLERAGKEGVDFLCRVVQIAIFIHLSELLMFYYCYP